MDSLGRRIIDRLTNTRSGERTVALLMFAYSFLAMTSHNILKPVTKSKFIDQLGSDNLPYVLMASSFLIGALMHLYGGAIRRLPRQYVIPIAQSVLAALLVVFWALLRTDAVWVTVALYFFGQILGVLLISQFWTLANEVYDARQAKRLFGLIGGGACLGGALGASITAITVERFGSSNLLLISAATLAICVAIVLRIIRLPHSGQHVEPGDERGVGGLEALRLLTQSRHLRVLAAVVGFAAIGAAIVDQQLSMAAEATGFDGDAIAALLAEVTVYLSLAGFVVQIALTSRIHRSFGIAAALLLLPIGLGAQRDPDSAHGALGAVAGARVLDSTLRYSIDKTTREVLFLPLSADLRFRAKPFIDVTMDRFAKAAAAALILVLIHPEGFGLGLAATELLQPARHGGVGRAGAHRLARIPACVPRQHRVARHRSREHPYRSRRRGDDRGARRGTVESRRTRRPLRHRPARRARQAKPRDAAVTPARIAAGTCTRAARNGRIRVADRESLDPDHRAHGPGRGR